ncbi:hypothetical protein E6R60_26675 [Streptomyces sp. A0642]|uniref:hypothetical protein n=1 Tax=Streptomyces sp. A0642 TaxID=2563100 RepID=UPI0010A23687|nr:hypothetical protein [Streptomyces sp. A0642]THA72517.1 hypothetical protein E6R60_26675 [Streptomyces sp. A0642]
MPDTTPTTQLRRTLDRVTDLHEVDGGACGTCADADGQAAAWPCETAQQMAVAEQLLRNVEEQTPARLVLGTIDQQPAHRCGNCEGIDPDTCVNNPHRPSELRNRLTRALDECRTMIPASQSDVVLSVLRKAGVLPAPTDRAVADQPADRRARYAAAIRAAGVYNLDAHTAAAMAVADTEQADLRAEVERLRKRAERAEAERDCLAMAVMFARQWKPDAPMSLRNGVDEILAAMPSRTADEAQQPDTGPTVGDVQAMLTRMQAAAADSSLTTLLGLIAAWYRSPEGRDVLIEGLEQAGFRLPADEAQQPEAAACPHVWVTALDENDRPALDETGSTWTHCGVCGGLPGDGRS